MTLHTKILQQARDSGAKKYGYTSWHHVEGACRTIAEIMAIDKEAALLAMDRQWSFMLWTFWTDWIYSDGRFINSKSGDVVSDLELYAIWKEGKGV